VSMEDGTGIVHIAPAYGEIDFEVGEKEGLPLVHTVELNGMVTTNLVTGFTPKAREYIQKSEAPVILGPAREKWIYQVQASLSKMPIKTFLIT